MQYTPTNRFIVNKRNRFKGCSEIATWVIKISLMKFMEGGQDIFRAQAINHIIIIKGILLTNPLIRAVFREFTLWYIMFIIKKRLAEHSPWAIIIKSPLLIPVLFIVVKVTITILMWATEDKAIRTFRSD